METGSSWNGSGSQDLRKCDQSDRRMAYTAMENATICRKADTKKEGKRLGCTTGRSIKDFVAMFQSAWKELSAILRKCNRQGAIDFGFQREVRSFLDEKSRWISII